MNKQFSLLIIFIMALGIFILTVAFVGLRPGVPFQESLPWEDIRDYGAVGDGVTDDTEAIRAAIAALPDGGGTVLIPHGRYLFTENIQIPDKVHLWGMGSQPVTSSNFPFGPMPELVNPGGTCACPHDVSIDVVGVGVVIENIQFRGGGTVLRLLGRGMLTLDRVMIVTGGTTPGFLMQAAPSGAESILLYVYNSTFEHVGSGPAVEFRDTGGSGMGGWIWMRDVVFNKRGIKIDITGATRNFGNLFIDNLLYENGNDHLIRVESNWTNGNRLQGVVLRSIQIQDPSAAWLDRGVFYIEGLDATDIQFEYPGGLGQAALVSVASPRAIEGAIIIGAGGAASNPIKLGRVADYTLIRGNLIETSP